MFEMIWAPWRNHVCKASPGLNAGQLVSSHLTCLNCMQLAGTSRFTAEVEQETSVSCQCEEGREGEKKGRQGREGKEGKASHVVSVTLVWQRAAWKLVLCDIPLTLCGSSHEVIRCLSRFTFLSSATLEQGSCPVS